MKTAAKKKATIFNWRRACSALKQACDVLLFGWMAAAMVYRYGMYQAFSLTNAFLTEMSVLEGPLRNRIAPELQALSENLNSLPPFPFPHQLAIAVALMMVTLLLHFLNRLQPADSLPFTLKLAGQIRLIGIDLLLLAFLWYSLGNRLLQLLSDAVTEPYLNIMQHLTGTTAGQTAQIWRQAVQEVFGLQQGICLTVISGIFGVILLAIGLALRFRRTNKKPR